jgi:hypothetical protein
MMMIILLNSLTTAKNQIQASTGKGKNTVGRTRRIDDDNDNDDDDDDDDNV